MDLNHFALASLANHRESMDHHVEHYECPSSMALQPRLEYTCMLLAEKMLDMYKANMPLNLEPKNVVLRRDTSSVALLQMLPDALPTIVPSVHPVSVPVFSLEEKMQMRVILEWYNQGWEPPEWEMHLHGLHSVQYSKRILLAYKDLILQIWKHVEQLNNLTRFSQMQIRMQEHDSDLLENPLMLMGYTVANCFPVCDSRL